MASRALLQLFTLSIIITKQIEAQSLNKTNNLKNLKSIENNTIENKRSVKTIESDRNDISLIKKTYNTDYNQRNDSNLESKYDKYNLKSNHIDTDKAEEERDENIKLDTTITLAKNELTSFHRKDFSNEENYSEHARQMNSNNRILVPIAQKPDIEEIKQDIETKLGPDHESFLPNNGKKNHPNVQRQGDLIVRHHNGKIRTTQAITNKLLNPKVMQMATEFDNAICKTKRCDYNNHRSFEKISRKNDIYILKRRDEITTASKRDNKLQHRYKKRNRTFKRITVPDNESFRHSDQSHTISKENEIYKQEHLVDIPSIEAPVTKKKPKYKPKLSHNFLKKKHHKKVVNKVINKTKQKSKHDYDKIKQTFDENREKKTDVRNGDNSEETLKPESDIQTSSFCSHDEEEILDSSEELLKFNPKLPFYVSPPPQTTKENIISQKDKNDVAILLDLTNKNIDLNKTIDQLASSKIIDLITDRVAGKMLKKLQTSQAFKDHFTTTVKEPEKVEQIDILFKNDGDMVMKNREYVKK